jgi:uncharacterized protein YqcC (DUF446 family)
MFALCTTNTHRRDGEAEAATFRAGAWSSPPLHQPLLSPAPLQIVHTLSPTKFTSYFLIPKMVSLISKLAIAGVVLVAVLYQFLIKHLVFGFLGVGREVASIQTYGHLRCQKVEELGLEACEDMWLHEKTGYLYMACSDSRSREQWLPAFGSSLHPEAID